MSSAKLITRTQPLSTGLALLIALLQPATSLHAALSGTRSVGPGGDYASLTDAITDIQAQSLGGALLLELQPAYHSSVETFPLRVPALHGASATNNVTIRPAAGASGLSITSADSSEGTVDLNGAQHVTIDGRPGGAGTAKQLTIANTSASGVAVRFINEASSNTLRHLTLQSKNQSENSGTVLFSTTTGANGNDNNALDSCDLRDGASTPSNALYSQGSDGTAEQHNSGNTVSRCNVFNFHPAALSALGAAGVKLSGGNTGWTITGNSFYQTAPRSGNSSGTGAISIVSLSGTGFIITDNFIGGREPNAVGAAWTMTNTSASGGFTGIALAAGGNPRSSVQGNIIQNITAVLPGDWEGISVSGAVDVGTVAGNVIGGGAGTGSITVTNALSITGIGSSSGGSLTIANNTIGSITGTTSTLSGILVGAGVNTISNNLIGSTTTPDSIQGVSVASASGLQVTGILADVFNSRASITDNTVANLSHHPTGSITTRTQLRGIATGNGMNTISGNTVRNLATTNRNTSNSELSSLVGIAQLSSAPSQTVSRNTVHSLANTSVWDGVNVIGIYYSGSMTGGTNLIAGNLVHSLFIASTSTDSELHGMYFGIGTFTAQNNMVCVGLDSAGASTAGVSTINGIYDISSAVARNFYHNSTCVVGTQTSGASRTHAFYSSTNSSGHTRNLRNNLCANFRGNSGTASGTHYAVRYGGSAASPAGLTANNNLFFVSGAGSALGRYNSISRTTLAAWQAATGVDGSSRSGDPLFINPAGDAASVDLHVQAGSPAQSGGIPITSITVDFDGHARSTVAPSIGADELTANQPPSFSGFVVFTGQDIPATITKSSLLARATDADGGIPAITGVSPASARGSLVSSGADSITYTPVSEFTGLDIFTITITDGQGGSTEGTVTVSVTSGQGAGGIGSQAALLPGGEVALLFFGTPGNSYEIQRSTGLLNWSTLATLPAAGDGTLPWTDPNPPGGSAFYRTKSQ